MICLLIICSCLQSILAPLASAKGGFAPLASTSGGFAPLASTNGGLNCTEASNFESNACPSESFPVCCNTTGELECLDCQAGSCGNAPLCQASPIQGFTEPFCCLGPLPFNPSPKLAGPSPVVSRTSHRIATNAVFLYVSFLCKHRY